MNKYTVINLLMFQPVRKLSTIYSLNCLILLSASALIDKNCFADEGLWQFDHTLHTSLQPYENTSDRESSFNAGYYLSADYLDSGSIGFSYNYTLVKLSNNADVTENLFYLSGQYHLYPDSLPGKLSLRLDSYFGEDILKYNITTPPPTPPGPGPGPGMGKTNTKLANPDIVEEITGITVVYSQLSFINYKKTFYSDIGFSNSEYDNSSKTEVTQITPTISFGWNDSYDWLQLRAYFVELKQTVSAYNDDKFDSLEAKYTHWLPEDASSQLELVRFTVLSGERVLAVDPDTATVYSIIDIQKNSVSGSAQWKLSTNTKILALLQYVQYQNVSLFNNYDGYLFYVNLQFKNK